MEYAVIVVGGGAAGMMATAAAGKGALLLEKNDSLGVKVGITGNGRCNVTNNCDVEQLIEKVLRNPYFLYSAFYALPPSDLISLLNGLGVPTKVEGNGRVFPVSDRSADVIDALTRHIEQCGGKIRTNAQVAGITKGDDGIFCVQLSDGEVLRAKSCILATGGLSLPGTGSTGDGFEFAGQFGHKVTKTSPAIVPLTCAEPWVGELMGISLSNVHLMAEAGKRKVFEGVGDVMFAHYGISGPLVLTASGFSPSKIRINLLPQLDDISLLDEFGKNLNRDIKNALEGLLPKAIIPVILGIAGVDAHKKVNSITKEERSRLVAQITGLTLTVTGNRGYKEAVITAGGVDVAEIDPSTMESKLVAGLYFAGEMIDVHAVTGGYNLHIAFSTGYLAGLSAK
ncbi:MAG: NAD(P)/FAD-dependent oxidoreductase [Defluviitaleaceae bacterium]|nr:NAD(P)/FAD-dependent oxidoreductase [Defluviitaleaceae bacterium]